MLLRCISGHEIPHSSGNDSNDGTEPERCAPAVVHDNRGNERGSETGPDTDATEDDTVGLSSFPHRKPTFNELAGCWIHCRFTCAECEAHQHENQDRTAEPGRHNGSKYSEESPPEHS